MVCVIDPMRIYWPGLYDPGAPCLHQRPEMQRRRSGSSSFKDTNSTPPSCLHLSSCEGTLDKSFIIRLGGVLWRTSWSHDHAFWSHDRHLTCSANQKAPRVSHFPRGPGYSRSLAFWTSTRQDLYHLYSYILLYSFILLFPNHHYKLQLCQARKYLYYLQLSPLFYP